MKQEDKYYTGERVGILILSTQHACPCALLLSGRHQILAARVAAANHIGTRRHAAREASLLPFLQYLLELLGTIATPYPISGYC